MPISSEMIEATAKAIAFAGRAKNDRSEDAAEFWTYTGETGQARYRKMAAASLSQAESTSRPVDERAIDAAFPIEEVQTVEHVDGFEQPAEPSFRIVVNEYCADFPSKKAAENFRREFCGAIRAYLSAMGTAGTVGEVGEMPGSNGGFTMAVFKASDVPLGTKLYASPQPAALQEPVAVNADDKLAIETMRAALENIARIEPDGDGYHRPVHSGYGALAIARSALSPAREPAPQVVEGTAICPRLGLPHVYFRQGNCQYCGALSPLETEIASVVQSVNEWDDRTSPDDYPEHLLITSEELTDILRNFAAALSATATECE